MTECIVEFYMFEHPSVFHFRGGLSMCPYTGLCADRLHTMQRTPQASLGSFMFTIDRNRDLRGIIVWWSPEWFSMLSITSASWRHQGPIAEHVEFGPMLRDVFGAPDLWRVLMPMVVVYLAGSDFYHGFLLLSAGCFDLYVRRQSDLPIHRWQRYRIIALGQPVTWMHGVSPTWMGSYDDI